MGFTSVGVGTTGSVSIIVDAGYLVDRVANILRRSDLKSEILHWINLAQAQLAHRADFPELLTTSPAIPLVADTYSYPLPADFSKVSNVLYKASYASPSWSKSLTPLPKRMYGEPIDLESQLNTSVSIRRNGDPAYYLVRDKTLIIDASPIAANLPADLYVTYYKSPAFMSTIFDTPEINTQWRTYLIWIALYWGKAALEQEDISKAAVWEAKAEKTIAQVARRINATENPVESYEMPSTGMEDSDSVY